MSLKRRTVTDLQCDQCALKASVESEYLPAPWYMIWRSVNRGTDEVTLCSWECAASWIMAQREASK